MNKQDKNLFLLDNRIIQRNIRDGRIEREEFDKFVASLPDLESECEDIGEEIYGNQKPGTFVTGDFISNQDEE